MAEVLNHANNLHHKSLQPTTVGVIAESEREGTLAETRIGLSAKRTSPFKSAGRSVQSTTGSRGVRISRQDYWLPTPFASFPFTSPPVRHRVPSHSDSALPLRIRTASDTWQHIDNKRRVHTSTDLELVTEWHECSGFAVLSDQNRDASLCYYYTQKLKKNKVTNNLMPTILFWFRCIMNTRQRMVLIRPALRTTHIQTSVPLW